MPRRRAGGRARRRPGELAPGLDDGGQVVTGAAAASWRLCSTAPGRIEAPRARRRRPRSIGAAGRAGGHLDGAGPDRGGWARSRGPGLDGGRAELAPGLDDGGQVVTGAAAGELAAGPDRPARSWPGPMTAAAADRAPVLDDGGQGGHRCRGGELAAVLDGGRASWRAGLDDGGQVVTGAAAASWRPCSTAPGPIEAAGLDPAAGLDGGRGRSCARAR